MAIGIDIVDCGTQDFRVYSKIVKLCHCFAIDTLSGAEIRTPPEVRLVLRVGLEGSGLTWPLLEHATVKLPGW